MTRKIYTSAQGKTVDLGALMLQNEQVRAVGNMHVNARGDLLDGSNQVIDKKSAQVQRQLRKQTLASQDEVVTSTRVAKQMRSNESVADEVQSDQETTLTTETEVAEPEFSQLKIPAGGLAAAIAKSKTLKQELEKTPRQLAQEQQGVKKI